MFKREIFRKSKISEGNRTMRILAYGTLREGDYNFTRMQDNFGLDAIKKVGEIVLPYFKMYDLKWYPTIIATSDEKDTVTFDVLDVTEECYRFINAMELGAGYKEIAVETQEYGKCLVYVYLKHYLNERTPVIESGDWFKHKQIEV